MANDYEGELSDADVALIKKRVAELADAPTKGISFEELLKRTGFTEEDLESGPDHGICKGGLIHTDPDEISPQL